MLVVVYFCGTENRFDGEGVDVRSANDIGWITFT
jgi:hypothetical protein